MVDFNADEKDSDGDDDLKDHLSYFYETHPPPLSDFSQTLGKTSAENKDSSSRWPDVNFTITPADSTHNIFETTISTSTSIQPKTTLARPRTAVYRQTPTHFHALSKIDKPQTFLEQQLKKFMQANLSGSTMPPLLQFTDAPETTAHSSSTHHLHSNSISPSFSTSTSSSFDIFDQEDTSWAKSTPLPMTTFGDTNASNPLSTMALKEFELAEYLCNYSPHITIDEIKALLQSSRK